MPNPDQTVSGEIRHLMRDKGWPKKRAVAASLNMRRSGKLRKGKRHGKRKHGRY